MTATASREDTVMMLPVDEIWVDPNNPRGHLADIDGLAKSIEQVGLVEPVVVREHPERSGEWMLVAGHRRHAAHVKLGREHIRAVRRPADGFEFYAGAPSTGGMRNQIDEYDVKAAEQTALVDMLVENLQRVDLNPIEEARGYERLVGFGWKQSSIARAVGRSPGTVSKRIRLLDLPERMLEEVAAGRLPVEDAYEAAAALNTKGVDRTALEEKLLQIITVSAGEGPRWLGKDISGVADLEVRRARQSVAMEDLTSELVGSNVLLPDPTPSGARRVEGWNGLDVDYDAHLAEPCSRAAAVWRGEAVREYWCIDPDRHLPDGESPVKLRTVPQETQVYSSPGQSTAQAEKDAAAEKRVEFYQSVVAMDVKALPVPVTAVYHEAVRFLISYSNGDMLRTAARVLDLDVKKSASMRSLVENVEEAFNADPTRATLAVLFGQIERDMAYTGRLPGDDHRYFFLDSLGYSGYQAELAGGDE